MFLFRKNTDYSTLSDEALVKEIRARKESAFNELYARYGTKIFRYFFRLLNQDKEKAEDFLQDFFVRVVEQLNRYNSEQKLSTWLYSIATNMCRNEWRNKQTKDRVLADFKMGESQVIENTWKQLDYKIAEDALQNTLAELEEIERELITLRFQQELSIKEIAEIIGLAEGTVKSRLFYLLKKLGKKLSAYNVIQN